MFRLFIANIMLCFFLISSIAIPQQRQQQQNRPSRDVPENVTVERDIVYGTGGGRDLKLNLYRPKSGSGPFPGIVFIHGGGWRNGSPNQFEPYALLVAANGYVAVSIEYRLSGEAIFPAAVEDCKSGIRWLRANAGKYHVDPDKIAVSGGSAGGHLSLLMGTSGGVKEFEGSGGNADVSSAVQLVIAFNPVSEFPVGSPGANGPVANFLGGTLKEVPDQYRKVTPGTWLDKKDPPMLLLHGTADETVPYQQSVNFVNALKNLGIEAQLYTGDDAGHGFFNREPWFTPTYKELQQFLDKHFK